MNPKTVSRRIFLQSSAGFLAALPLGFAALAGGNPKKNRRIPIGLQLYSVRDGCKKDFEKTMAAVAKMGYQGVEFAGYYDRSAKQIRALLKANGLQCCGTHTGLDTLLGEAFPKTVEFNRTIQNPYLIVPWLPEERVKSKAAWLRTAALFNELAERLKPSGLRLGYHSHAYDFKSTEGETPWNLFAGNTGRDIILQIDTGNALSTGSDPVPFLKQHPGRTVTVHLKEYSATRPDAIIGEGDIRWRDVFGVCESTGGTEWYIVEDEVTALTLQRVKQDLDALRKMDK